MPKKSVIFETFNVISKVSRY